MHHLNSFTNLIHPIHQSPNSEKLNFWHSFYIFVSIILITLIAPLYPLTNYIYLITLASMFILSLTIYLQLSE